ncbi:MULTISPECIES: response regulator [unclassified Enterococcus]|uniref:response regulator n=1 Tax=unclassified Enterococcus TaxID=2608891 RepID=UPI0015523BF4|nr:MULTISPECIES: response regulator [unclassified Enterococcus]MBS7576816.1 response regulator [Enterococcus sp. MMGLQ5-2]MBS7584223.1 response regulator [Enterococcus sp. MMGLQ5-1]NPD12079.1 response regulator [Enterococcus sp. MMGLQ5-1]NPD36651.1 response regulator [Enterococcus sp. MMGLQ5-2]
MSKLKLLIVEDDPMVLYINKNYLNKMAIFDEILEADAFDSAIKQLHHQSFDLVLIDIHLKQGNGLELAKAIRAKNIKTEIIMVTASNDRKDIQEMLKLGISDYLVKPFNFNRLEKSILTFLNKKNILEQTEKISQTEIDTLVGLNGQHSLVGEKELEKGLTRETANQILKLIQAAPAVFTVNDFQEKTKLSHVSIRKYFKFFEKEGWLVAQTEYGSIGRPIIYYSINPTGQMPSEY